MFFVRELFTELDLMKHGAIEELEAEMITFAFTGPAKRGVLALRGFGKTWMLVAAQICWDLFRDKEMKLLVVSKSLGAAKSTLAMVKKWLRSVWFLEHLAPGPNCLDNATQFDVAGIEPSRSPSLTAAGIDSQLPNLRAHKVYCDDGETPQNTETVDAREKLDGRVKEFVAIASYGAREIFYVGTFHHVETLYVKLFDRGYEFRSYPLVLPEPGWRILGLSPILQRRLDAGAKPWEICFPHRHSPEVVAEKLAEGRTWFLQQYGLVADTGEVNLYPLRLADLIVPDFDMSPLNAPAWVKWGVTTHNGVSTKREDIRCLGFVGDGIHRQIMFSTEAKPYAAVRMHVDPSGRGADETTAGVGGFCQGLIHVPAIHGWREGTSLDTLNSIAWLARLWRVQSIHVEPNFGDGMFTQLLRPVLMKLFVRPGVDPNLPDGWTCSVDDLPSSTGQKEIRILDTLEPVTQQHRVVVAPSCLTREQVDVVDGRRKVTEIDLPYCLQYQIVNLTRQRKALKHDDRVECLAGVCALFTDMLDTDPARVAANDLLRKREERIRQYLSRFPGGAGDEPGWFTHQ